MATEDAQSCCQSSACANSGVFLIGNQKNCQLTMFSQKEQNWFSLSINCKQRPSFSSNEVYYVLMYRCLQMWL